MEKVVGTLTVLYEDFMNHLKSCFCCRVFDKFPIFCFSVSDDFKLIIKLVYSKISDDSITEAMKGL